MEIIDRHPGDTFLMLRASYVNICNGNLVAAALIHIFEQWHISKIKNRDQDRRYRTSNAMQTPRDVLIEGLYQWHTTGDLERQLMGLGKRDKIQEARAQLVSMGIITEHRNPNPKFAFDKTTYFIFYPEAVATYLDLRRQPATDISTASVAPGERTTENSQREGENRDYTNTTSIDHSTDHSTDSPAAGASVDKKTEPVKKTASRKKTPGAENDKDWQRWVDRYEDHVKDRNGGTGHRWDGAQLGPQGLKGIRAHLVKISTKLEGKSDDDCGYGAWCYILDNWDSLREWLQGQFDLTVILKKITDILNSLRNGTNTNRGAHTGNNGKPGTSAARVEALRDY